MRHSPLNSALATAHGPTSCVLLSPSVCIINVLGYIMKSMKLFLTTLLIFGTMPLTQEYGIAESTMINGIKVTDLSKTQKRAPSLQTEPPGVEVELIRMVDPFGNEVKYSLSETVMGRSLNIDDYSIPGIRQPEHSVLCQKTLSNAQELKKVELKLEMEMLVEELSSQPKPRSLTDLQIETLSKVPTCESFRLPLTAINKLLGGYDYEGLAQVME